MIVLIFVSLALALQFSVLDWRKQQTHGTPISLDDKLIDGPIISLLGDGTIRLLRCRWLPVRRPGWPVWRVVRRWVGAG